MTRDEILTQTRQMIANQCGASLENIQEPTRFIEDLAFDSLEAVELMMRVEDDFNIAIEDDDMESLTTVAKLVDYIHTLTEQRGF